jgi:hypothetical protein
MRFSWRRRRTPVQRLVTAAGLDSHGTSDREACGAAAFRIVRRDAGTTAMVLAVAEDLVTDEVSYDIVWAFLEDVQNLVSHPVDGFYSPPEIEALLGSRCAVLWRSIDAFWARAARWCEQNGVPLKSSQELLSVQNEQLRGILWPGNRTLPGGSCIGLAGVLGYEKAGGELLPGYGHVTAALDAAGDG